MAVTIVLVEVIQVLLLMLKNHSRRPIGPCEIIDDDSDNSLYLQPNIWVPISYSVAFDQTKVNVNSGYVLSMLVVELSLLA